MADFDCADCRMLWRDYSEAVSKYVNLENQQRKAASAGYLNLFRDLTRQLRQAEMKQNDCWAALTNHERERHTATATAATAE